MLMNSMVIGKTLVRLESLWEANMEYIDPNNALDSRDRHWKIYSRNLISPPNFFGEHGHIEDSLVVDGCSVDGMKSNTPSYQQKLKFVKEQLLKMLSDEQCHYR